MVFYIDTTVALWNFFSNPYMLTEILPRAHQLDRDPDEMIIKAQHSPEVMLD